MHRSVRLFNRAIDRRSNYIFAAFIICSCLLAYASLTKDQYWDGDFASYMMQAKSIVNGDIQQFVKENQFAMEMSLRQVGPVAYPWGTPFILSAVYLLFGMNLIGFKCINIACYIIFLIVLRFGMKERLSEKYLMALIFIFAFNPNMLSFMNHIMSDILFLLFSTLTVVFMGHMIGEKPRPNSKVLDNILLGILFSISFSIRTNGILLVATFLVVQIIVQFRNCVLQAEPEDVSLDVFQKFILYSKRAGIKCFGTALLPYLTFMVFMIAWRFVFPEGGSSHLSFFSNLSIEVILKNILYYVELPAEFFSSVPLSTLLFGTMIPFMMVGIFQNYMRDIHILVYVALTLSLYIVWPFVQGARFIFPILPFILFYVFVGISSCLKILSAKYDRLIFKTIVACVFLLIGVFFVKESVVHSARNIRANRLTVEGVFSKNAQEMFTFINSNTDENAIVIFFKPRIMRMRSGRQSLLIDNEKYISRGDFLCIYLGIPQYHQLSDKKVQEMVGKGLLDRIYYNPLFDFYQIN